VGDELVAFVTGGEPVDGCEPVGALIAGSSRSAIVERARALGVWHPHLWPNFRPSRS